MKITARGELTDWMTCMPVIVRQKTYATLYRAPVEEVADPSGAYFDSKHILSMGIVESVKYVVFGAKTKAAAIGQARAKSGIKSDTKTVVVKSSFVVGCKVTARPGDVLEYVRIFS